MKHFKKPMAIILSVLLSMAVLQTGTIISHADSFFDDGDFRYAVTSDDTLSVAGYYGSETELVLPERVGDRLVTGIHTRCFENSNVTSIVIPRDYTVIGNFAFSGCASLSYLELPSSLESIGVMAFYGCQALGNVDFSYTAIETISFAAFEGCSSMTSVSLPDSVTSLGDNAFCNCTSLGTLRLSEALTYIPEYCFCNCGLTALSLPETVTEIGEGAFSGNNELGGVFLSGDITSIGTDSFSPMLESADFEARCFVNTYAEDYLNENGAVNIRAYLGIAGDVNLDDILNVVDATLIQKHVAGLEAFVDKAALALADANGDGRIDVTDATAVQRRAAGME